MTNLYFIGKGGEGVQFAAKLLARTLVDKDFIQGNKAVAISAMKSGLDFLVGYPITPSTEVTEYIAQNHPKHFFQTSSEIETGNMMYGIAAMGKKVMTATSGCGLSLMREALSYACGAHLPMVIVDVMRFGPGLGGITPSTQDISIVKNAGHGFSQIVGLTPHTVQEIYDFIPIAFEIAFKHRIPVIVMYDAILGQMWESCDMHDININIDKVDKWAIGQEEHHKITSRSKVTSFRIGDGEQVIQTNKLLEKEEKIRFTLTSYISLDAEIKKVHGKPILAAIGTTARSVKKAAEELDIGYFISKHLNGYYNLRPHSVITIEVGGHQLADMLSNNDVRTIVFPNKIPSPEEIIKECQVMCL